MTSGLAAVAVAMTCLAAGAARAADCNHNGAPDERDTSLLEFESAVATPFRGGDFGPLVAANMDGDGATDAVVMRPPSVFFGRGDGRFGPPVLLDQVGIPMTVADVDGDGAPDVVTGDESVMRIIRNLGGRRFASPVEMTVPVRLQQLSAADIDADGDMDLIAAGIDALAVLFNDGSARFSAGPVHFAPFVYPTRLFSADFDADGDLDVLLGDTQLAVALNDGDGALQDPELLWDEGRGPAYAAGDLDGDGDLDLVAGDSFFEVIRIGRNDDGAFSTAQQFRELRGVTDLYLQDRDGDGDLDIVALTAADLTVLRNLGTGRFELGARAPALSSRLIAPGDFNRDGVPDTLLLGGYYYLAVAFGTADGTVVAPRTAATGDEPGSMLAADLDGDGDRDLAVTNFRDGTVSVIRNLDGALSAPLSVAAGEMPQGIASGDLDRDGDLDLVVGHDDTGFPSPINSISLLLNRGDASFTRTANLEVGTAPYEVAIADLNGDAQPDIIAAGMFGYLTVFLNQDGSFAERRNIAVGAITRGLAVGDVDRDGDLDLAVAGGAYPDTLRLLRNRGDARFDAEPLPIGVGEVFGVALADLEPDGDLDMIATTFYGDVVTLPNPGVGQFGATVVNDLTVQGSGLSAGDIDGDGDADLAVATTDGALALFRNGGGGVFSAHDFVAAGGAPRAALLADVVGGPELDLLSLNGRQVLVSANRTSPAVSQDCNADRVPDECQLDGDDCDGNAVPDDCQLDSDADSVPDACDLCRFDDDRVDGDADQHPDCADNCPATANPGQANGDGDLAGDACDGCPTDTFKTEPGPCGCGRIEYDENGDGTPECSSGCAGDCNGDGTVSIAELVRAVRVALGEIPRNRCLAIDLNRDDFIAIAELISGVQRALFGCP